MEVLAEPPAFVPAEGKDSGAEENGTTTRSTSQRNESTKRKERVFMPEIFASSCKFIPMRLTPEERQILEVLENALNVSDYTDTVDIFARSHKRSRIFEGLKDVLSIATGLMVANNLKVGEDLMLDKNLDMNIPFFRDMFEIGRRYKIMNPTKMRETYGKMMFILQDTELVSDELGDTFIKRISTVHSFLQTKDKLHLLLDSRVMDATQSIGNTQGKLSREELMELSAAKADAAQLLKEKYATKDFTEEDIQRVLDSVSDNEAYFALNATPVERIITFLTNNFTPKKPTGDYSLELRGGGGGGHRSTFSNLYGYSRNYFGGGQKLSHSHEQQFHFVHQSFLLWHEIMKSMPKLWLLADRDLIHESYRLTDTGQGLHRLQRCPTVSEEMSRILHRVQGSVGERWVGLSVVHLGDRDVPNALVFIDKYSQVTRILAPIVNCLENVPQLISDDAFHSYVRAEWGSVDDLKLQVLSDFFKHGFDGSGDDGGSCIDGRLTSAWNWCSKLHKKPYYYVFLFSGFQGFDGDWKS